MSAMKRSGEQHVLDEEEGCITCPLCGGEEVLWQTEPVGLCVGAGCLGNKAQLSACPLCWDDKAINVRRVKPAMEIMAKIAFPRTTTTTGIIAHNHSQREQRP